MTESNSLVPPAPEVMSKSRMKREAAMRGESTESVSSRTPTGETPESETGWVIVYTTDAGDLSYLTGEHLPRWSLNPNQAIRFARKVDAETMIQYVQILRGWGGYALPLGVRAEEHMWEPRND